MAKRHLLPLLALACSPLAIGDEHLNKLYIPFGGQYYDFDEHSNIDGDVMPELGIGYRIGNRSAAEVMFSRADTDTHRQATRRSVDVNQVRADYLHFYNDWQGFVPYSVAGYGYNDYDATNSIPGDGDTDFINFGAGLLKNIDDNWAARLDLRDIHQLKNNQNEYAVHLTMQYRFGTSPAPAKPVAATPAPAKVAAPEPAAPADIVPAAPAQPEKRVEIKLNVNFATASDVVPRSYFKEIKRVADYLKKYPDTTATIEGHTDSRGDDAYNQNLSERRANAIRNVLINEHKVDASRVKAIGYGEAKPLADNNTTSGRYKNRRVVAVFE